MIIQIDSREQKFDHVTKYLDSQDIKWVKSKCVVGDYVNLENPMVVIDRKKDLHEVCSNVTKDHERFVRELELAKELGYKMIVLVEEPTITSVEQVFGWYNWRRKKNPRAMSGKQLRKIMLTMSEKYEFEWQFTTKEKCGERIVELLEGNKER